MEVNLSKEVEGGIDLREALILSLGQLHPERVNQTLKDIAKLRERIIDASGLFEMSTIEVKYCVNAILLSDHSKETKYSLIGALDDNPN